MSRVQHPESSIQSSVSSIQGLAARVQPPTFASRVQELRYAVDVASGYKVARALRTKKASEVSFVLEAIYKKGGGFKYPKVFECDNGSEFKSDVAKLLEKHNVDIRRTTTKYKHTQKAFVEAFKEDLA